MVGQAHRATYMASKAAINRFTEALAGECVEAGVRVFTMRPGNRIHLSEDRGCHEVPL